MSLDLLPRTPLPLLLAWLAPLPLGALWLTYLRRRGVSGGVLWLLPAGLTLGLWAAPLLWLQTEQLWEILSSFCAGVAPWHWATISSVAHLEQGVVLSVATLLLLPAWRRVGPLAGLWAVALGLGATASLLRVAQVAPLQRPWHPEAGLGIAPDALAVVAPLLAVALGAALVGSGVALRRAPPTPRGRWDRRLGLGLLALALVTQAATVAWGVALDTITLRPDLEARVALRPLPTLTLPPGDAVDASYGDALKGYRAVRDAQGRPIVPPAWRLAGFWLRPDLARSLRRSLTEDGGPWLLPADTPLASLPEPLDMEVVTLLLASGARPDGARVTSARVHRVQVVETEERLERAAFVFTQLATPVRVVDLQSPTPDDVAEGHAWVLAEEGWTLGEALNAEQQLRVAGFGGVTFIPRALAPEARAISTRPR
ncbi:MAG: hypothetical protein H6739_41785 [Alphaproteobacteria bacterium]|nr:hypothetical protein [Alphaproteobacteria bacterium]